MIKCPECGEENNLDGSTYCENCSATLSVSLAQPKKATSGGGLVCPKCDKPVVAGNSYCESCGGVLAPVSPAGAIAPAGPPVVATVSGAPAPALAQAPQATPTPAASTTSPATGLAKGQVKLVVEQGRIVGKQYVLNDDDMLVGREDEEDGCYPDIDLADIDDEFIHRRHARLRFSAGALVVIDLGGKNRSYVNNKPLTPNVDTPVAIGDKIKFGKIVMRVQSA